MKIIHRAYKYRLLPNKEQRILLGKHFGCTRWVFNHFLGQRKEQYEATKKSDNYTAQAAKLTKLKKQEETSWLKEVNSQSLQQALNHLDTAYERFFKGLGKYPKFKSRKRKNSFNVPQFVKVVGNHLYVPKFKQGIKIKLHRELKGKIKQCTISKTPTGKYFVSILVEETYEPLAKTKKATGIDLGLKDYATLANGAKSKNHKYLKKYGRKLATAQRHLSRKQKGSHSFEKQRLKVARLHEKVANCRKDILHKLSAILIKKYDVICLEDLNIKGMMAKPKPKFDESENRYVENGVSRKKSLNRSISDAAWGMFGDMLAYKSKWNNKIIVKTPRFEPTSKKCHKDGYIFKELKLSDRHWTCPKCGTYHDRDINAAKNILKEGLKILSAGMVDYTGGEGKMPSVKPEAHKSLACR